MTRFVSAVLLPAAVTHDPAQQGWTSQEGTSCGSCYSDEKNDAPHPTISDGHFKLESVLNSALLQRRWVSSMLVSIWNALLFISDLSAFCSSLNWIYLAAVLVSLQNHILWNSVFHAGRNCCGLCSMYDLFCKTRCRITAKKNFSLWSCHVKPILLFQELELALGSCLATALCVTVRTALDTGWNVLGAYVKGELPTSTNSLGRGIQSSRHKYGLIFESRSLGIVSRVLGFS